LPTHRIRPIALDITIVAIIPVAAESKPCPAQTRTFSIEDDVPSELALDEVNIGTIDDIWVIMKDVIACRHTIGSKNTRHYFPG
jgi:hypothetical protein